MSNIQLPQVTGTPKVDTITRTDGPDTVHTQCIAPVNPENGDPLAARGGSESFDWTPPSGAAGKFVCKSWRRVADNGYWNTITATFEEVFGD